MGICSSCLGTRHRHRHPSQDREIDRLLNSDQSHSAYGTIDHGSYAQPDEEELRREREALEHITAQAADHMIDVLHPSQSELDYAHRNTSNRDTLEQPANDFNLADRSEREAKEHAEDPDEAAWLESIQSAQLDSVQIPKRGALVLDISLLRDSHPHRSTKAESAY